MRALRIPALSVFFAIAAFAAEEGGAEAHHADGDPFLIPRLVNFAILAAGIAFLLFKVLGPIFQGQRKEILEKMEAASRRATEAAAQAREIDQRLSGLEGEVDALRRKAREEMQAESQRIENETQAQLAKIQQGSEQELASAVKAARQELKAYSAQLAVDLARKKIEARMDDAAQAGMVERFSIQLGSRHLEKN